MGFKDQKLIKKTKVDTRVNAIVNRLNATKREDYPDLAAEREAYEKEVPSNEPSAWHWSVLTINPYGLERPHCDLHVQVRIQKKAEIQAQKRSEKAAKEAAAREKDMRSYTHVMKVWCSSAIGPTCTS